MQADESISPIDPPTRKRRRDIRACAPCRRKKIRCDGQTPCNRCAASTKPNSTCVYLDINKDPIVERLERLEHEHRLLAKTLQELRNDRPTAMEIGQHVRPMIEVPPGSDLGIGIHSILEEEQQTVLSASTILNSQNDLLPLVRTVRGYEIQDVEIPSVVAHGIVTESQALHWFESFFQGIVLFVPVFSPQTDSYHAIAERSSLLFDVIVTMGCRSIEGPRSAMYENLSRHLKMRTANLVTNLNLYTKASIETVQALVAIASYSETGGWLLSSLALRMALHMDLPDMVEKLLAQLSNHHRSSSDSQVTDDIDLDELLRAMRVWFGAFNLEHILSLDGEKPPSVSSTQSTSRLRALIYHPKITVIDLRLLSQVELNIIRNRAHGTVESRWSFLQQRPEEDLDLVVRDACLEFDVWYTEWKSIIGSNSQKYESRADYSTALLNLNVQYNWAIVTLHLKAVSNTGVENIAVMTGYHTSLVRAAKDAAVRNLQLFLKGPSEPTTPSENGHPREREDARSIYLGGFKWAMDFVWAKAAFSILLILRLSLLLRDPPERLIQLVQDCRAVFAELQLVSSGHMAYLNILQVSIEKFEHALRNRVALYASQEPGGESEFEAYHPREFAFEWDFPGLNLTNVPLGWQDLFLDLDAAL